MPDDTDDAGARRAPTPAKAQGHRKLAALLATVLAGQVAGEDALAWAWHELVLEAQALGVPLGDMPESTAIRIFVLIAALFLYLTREESTT